MTWRPRRFRVGAMRERVTVTSETLDESSGEPNLSSTTTIVDDEPATYEIVSGGETVRGRQVDATVDAVFIVHHRRSTYSVTQKLTHDGNEYGIVKIIPTEGGDRYLELHCKRDYVSTVS